MTTIITALLSALVLTAAQHLGLAKAVIRVCLRIAECPMCLTFWGTLAVLLLTGSDPLLTAALSMAMSYASNWIALLFVPLDNLYNKLWQRLTKRRSR